MKNGFTLVELLGVILILALLGLLIYPTVTGIVKSSRTKSYEAQKELVIEDARLWVTDNDNLLSDTVGSVYKLYINDLKTGGYLANVDVKNLETNVTLDNACVQITTATNKYTYSFVEDCN